MLAMGLGVLYRHLNAGPIFAGLAVYGYYCHRHRRSPGVAGWRLAGVHWKEGHHLASSRSSSGGAVAGNVWLAPRQDGRDRRSETRPPGDRLGLELRDRARTTTVEHQLTHDGPPHRSWRSTREQTVKKGQFPDADRPARPADRGRPDGVGLAAARSQLEQLRNTVAPQRVRTSPCRAKSSAPSARAGRSS